MGLINLHDFIEKTISEFDGSYVSQDRKLPEAFKQYVKSRPEGDKFIFFDYTTVVSTPDLRIYCPNQWFYIAAYYCKLYPVLMQYKNAVFDNATVPASNKAQQDFFTELVDDYKKAETLFSSSGLESDQVELLSNFVSNYGWWRGGKGIERPDFYFSPILSSAALVNQSQSYVADICKYLVENPTALTILQGAIRGKSASVMKSIIVEETVLSTFMEKCVKEFLAYDPDFSRAKFKINAVTVGWSGCKLGMLFSEFKKVTDPRRLGDCNETIRWTTDGKEYCFYKEQDARSFGVFKKSFNALYRETYEIVEDNGVYRLLKHSVSFSEGEATEVPESQQVIFYGAPGTGKSHTVEEKYVKGHKSFRITFHPDTDYASFVGCYKPSMKTEKDDPTKEEIAYAFVPQVFLNAYIYSWNHPEATTYLVIEELNRGNCAQIFGDVFQLLDRQVLNYPGFSKYKINADTDIADYLQKHIDDHSAYENKLRAIYQLDSFDFSVMALPDNLYILATMNTSDQSLFPIDSAFKRRWEWEYIPVNYDDASLFTLRIDEKHKYNWGEVLKGLNNYIKGEKKSTNKILGNRFVHAGADNVIGGKAFRDKVLFFLFNDVFRDDDEFKKAFFGDNYEDMFFEDLCVANDTEFTIRFIENTCKARNIAKDDSPVAGGDDESLDEKQENTPELKPEESSEEKQEDTPELKPEENSEEESEDTPEVKPEENTEEKPDGTTE